MEAWTNKGWILLFIHLTSCNVWWFLKTTWCLNPARKHDVSGPHSGSPCKSPTGKTGSVQPESSFLTSFFGTFPSNMYKLRHPQASQFQTQPYGWKQWRWLSSPLEALLAKFSARPQLSLMGPHSSHTVVSVSSWRATPVISSYRTMGVSHRNTPLPALGDPAIGFLEVSIAILLNSCHSHATGSDFNWRYHIKGLYF